MKITIIGCGNMGKGLAERLSETNQLSLYDRNTEKVERLGNAGYGKAYTDIEKACAQSEIILLAVKPQNLKEIAPLVKKSLKKGQTVISLLAGVSLETLQHFLPNTQLVRMMPNLALIYGAGVIGLFTDKQMETKEKEALSTLFAPLGKVVWLAEDKINALTSLTGSGPAFFFAMTEAMIEAGIAMGFTAKDAQELTYHMLRGSLVLLEKTMKHPGELKWQIASPQGTTISGLKKLEELALRGGIMNTFLAAYERANDLTMEHQKNS